MNDFLPELPAGTLAFLKAAGGLKRVVRQGWLDRGIPGAESVADHTFRVALMAWMLGEAAALDVNHLVKLVLVHDLPEALAGDATPYLQLIRDGLAAGDAAARWRELLSDDDLEAGRREKLQAEEAAIQELTRDLDPPVATEVAGLWTEYAEQRTLEARFASELDKLEVVLQAMEYQALGYESDLGNFLKSAREHVHHPVLKRFLAEIEGQLGA